MGRHDPINADPITVERIERWLDGVAVAIEMAGPNGGVYLPIYERLERELVTMRQRQASMTSVQARLERLSAR